MNRNRVIAPARFGGLQPLFTRVGNDLENDTQTLSDEEKDIARLFLDSHRAGMLFEMLNMKRLIEISYAVEFKDRQRFGEAQARA